MPKRNAANELSSTLSTLLGLQPSLNAAQSQYGQQNASTQLSTLQSLLLGVPEFSYDTEEFTPSIYQKGNKYGYGALPQNFAGEVNYGQLPAGGKGGGGGGGGGAGDIAGLAGTGVGFMAGGPVGAALGGKIGGSLFGSDGPRKKTISPESYRTVTHTTPAQRGLLSYGTDLNEATDEANPEAAAILRLLLAGVMGEGVGQDLSPEQQRMVQQSSRAAYGARGLNASPVSAFDEILKQIDYGRGLQQQRIGNANNALTQNKALYGDTIAQLLGLGQVSGAFGQGVGQQLFSQDSLQSPYFADVYGSNANAKWAADIADKNNEAGILGGLIGAGGNLGGAAIGLCWVARAVFGETNPEWHQFRWWLFMHAPARFFKLYLKHGERFALWLQDKPRLKAVIRWWMRRRIAYMHTSHQKGVQGAI